MQSKMIEEDIPKEKAAQMVSDTVTSIQRQGELTRKRKLILYGGRIVLFAVYLFLGMVGRQYDFEPQWVRAVIAIIGVFVWDLGSRALYCLLTGEPFFVKQESKWRTKQAKIAQIVLLLAMGILLAVVMLFRDVRNHWRDLLVVLCLAAILGSGMLMNEIEKRYD